MTLPPPDPQLLREPQLEAACPYPTPSTKSCRLGRREVPTPEPQAAATLPDGPHLRPRWALRACEMGNSALGDRLKVQ